MTRRMKRTDPTANERKPRTVYLTHREAAQFLRVSPRTLHDWIRNDREFAERVRRSKVGPRGSQHWLYDRGRLEKIIELGVELPGNISGAR